MPETHSKLAIALADAIVKALPDSGESNEHKRALAAKAIDDRLAETRKHYESEKLDSCPIITHHPLGACAFCLCAAMREFITIPEKP